MKILLVADVFEASTRTEASRWLHDLVPRWMKRGHSVHILVHPAREGSTADLFGDEDDPPGVPVLRPPPSAFEETLGELLEHDPDIVHIASSGTFSERVVEILRDLPVLLDAHDFSPICPNHDLLRRPRLSPCGEHFPHPNCGNCAGLSRLRSMEERMGLIAASNLIVVHSGYARARVSASLGRRVERVDYGVDVSSFGAGAGPPRSAEVTRLLASPEVPRILLLGAPSLARGAGCIIDLLVAVGARVPAIEIVVAGHDPEHPDWHEAFRAEARDLGIIHRLQLLSDMPASDMPALHRACQVAMAPMVGLESGGLSILEAMASGLPVVASPLGAVQDLIEDGEDGMLIAATRIPEFADAVFRLLEDPAAREVLGEAARTRVAQRHGIDRSLARLEVIYESVRGEARKKAA